MKTLGNVLMLTAAAGLLIFPAAYAYTSRGLWRYSQVGRSLMWFQGVLAAVMLFAIANLLLGPLPLWVRPIVWACIAFVSWRQVWVLFKVRTRNPVS